MGRKFSVIKGESKRKTGAYEMPWFEIWRLCWARQHDKENLRKMLPARVLQRHDFYDNEAGVFLFFTYIHICVNRWKNIQHSRFNKGLTVGVRPHRMPSSRQNSDPIRLLETPLPPLSPKTIVFSTISKATRTSLKGFWNHHILFRGVLARNC